LLKIFAKKLLAAVLPFSFLHWLSRRIMQCGAGKGARLSGLGGSYPGLKETFPRGVILPLSTLEFEGNQYTVPHNWDYFLTQFYGSNYMQPPPDDKKVNHGHDVIFDVEKNEIGRLGNDKYGINCIGRRWNEVR
jgi:lipopolysaccharide cholinephosphotransferase